MWTYKASRGLFVCTDGSGSKKRKQLGDEVTAWLYCAERNGEAFPPRGEFEKGQDYRERLREWAEYKMKSEAIDVPAEALEPVVDDGLLVGSSSEVVRAIHAAGLNPTEAAALLEQEQQRRRVRESVVDALREIAGATE